jgi:hypothetical protein
VIRGLGKQAAASGAEGAAGAAAMLGEGAGAAVAGS